MEPQTTYFVCTLLGSRNKCGITSCDSYITVHIYCESPILSKKEDAWRWQHLRSCGEKAPGLDPGYTFHQWNVLTSPCPTAPPCFLQDDALGGRGPWGMTWGASRAGRGITRNCQFSLDPDHGFEGFEHGWCSWYDCIKLCVVSEIGTWVKVFSLHMGPRDLLEILLLSGLQISVPLEQMATLVGGLYGSIPQGPLATITWMHELQFLRMLFDAEISTFCKKWSIDDRLPKIWAKGLVMCLFHILRTGMAGYQLEYLIWQWRKRVMLNSYFF